MKTNILVEITYILCGCVIMLGTLAYCMDVFTIGEFIVVLVFGIVTPVVQLMIAYGD